MWRYDSSPHDHTRSAERRVSLLIHFIYITYKNMVEWIRWYTACRGGQRARTEGAPNPQGAYAARVGAAERGVLRDDMALGERPQRGPTLNHTEISAHPRCGHC